MSKLKILAVLFVGSMVAKAAIFPPQMAYNTTYSNLLSFSTSVIVTNSVSVTNYIEQDLYHTLAYSVTTNGVSQPVLFIADTSLDTTNWFPQATNSIAQTGGSSYYAFTGKWRFIRVRTTVTNGTGNAQYLGGR